MLGDDPDPMVMPARVGFGTGFDRAREGVLCTMQRGFRTMRSQRTTRSEEGKEDGLGGLWRDCEGEKRERARHLFPETENVR